MKLQSTLLTAAILALINLHSSAATLYVDLNSANPVPPYADWSTAATNIQDAVDAANVGDTVLVTNGVYQIGSRADEYDVSNRVAVTKPITVESVNGPAVTLIDGGGAVRCVYLTNNTMLIGFTLTNGVASGNGGGVWCEDLSAIVTNCVLSDNSTASLGAGAYGGTLNNCTLTNNNLNGFFNAGGGAAYCLLNNCILVGNNAIDTDGGGAYESTLNSCLVFGNYADGEGGGAFASTLNNCTLVNNFAWEEGAGADISTLNNCIEYYNSDTGYDFLTSTYNDCCTEQLPQNGEGNFTNTPLFVDYAGNDFHLQFDSPCINAGKNAYVTWITDLDGNPRIANGLVDVGAYEFQSKLSSGTMRFVNVDNVNPTPPYTNWASAANIIQDAIDVAVNGDEILVTNGVYKTGGRAVNGALTNRVVIDKRLIVESVNGPAVTTIQGSLGVINNDSAVRCVFLVNNAELTGFTLTDGATRNSGDSITEQCGGGVFGGGIVSNCVIVANSAYNSGGGAMEATLDNCILFANSAHGGGGVFESTLNNCALTGNSALGSGGGASSSVLNNCTITGNSAASYAGGADEYSTLNNCILYYNTAPTSANYVHIEGGTGNPTFLNYCCTTPDPNYGTGNITDEPQLIDYAHINSGSPCRGAGSEDYVSGVDIDGEPWLNPPSIGCDEYYAGAINGSLSAAIQMDHSIVVPGYTVNFIGIIVGHTSTSIWNFGDGTTVTNQLMTSHVWANAGNYPVTLTVYNNDNPSGVGTTVIVPVVTQPVFYVNANSVNPVAPYASWDTAATNIQDAVDAVSIFGSRVIVTNGIYSPTVLTKAVAVQSVNGAVVTIIDGGNSIQCAQLDPNSTLTGFTLTNGTDGAEGGTLNNCIICGNGNVNTPDFGGGVNNSILNNCLLYNNIAAFDGGGANDCILNSCTLIGNVSYYGGGGAFESTLNNCIEYYNQGSDDSIIIYNYSCTDQLPSNEANNFTNVPLFISVSSGDYHLQSNSPCINAGNNSYVSSTNDLDGDPRIVGGTVDIGAYEYQLPSSILSYAWAQQYGLPTDGSADYADSDGDGMNNWQEWIAGTDPTNALSVLEMLFPTATNNPTGLVVSWQSVNTRTYYLQSSPNLSAQPAFSTIQSNIVGQVGTTSYTDTTATNGGPYFYRVGVQ